MTNKVSATLPKIVRVQDYHEFDEMQYMLNSILNENVRVKEVGFDSVSGVYIGVVYTGRRPDAKELAKLLSTRS